MGIESNPLAVHYSSLWFLLKVAFAFGLPLGLYRLDTYLDGKPDEGFFPYLNGLVALVYITVLFADIFFFVLVLRNSRVLGCLLLQGSQVYDVLAQFASIVAR